MKTQNYSASAREDPEDLASQATILTLSTCNTNIADQHKIRSAPAYLGEVRVLTELNLLQHESPDVVAEPVGVQLVRLTGQDDVKILK